MSRYYINRELSIVPEDISFPEEEENILKFWKDERPFEKCHEQSMGKPR